MRYRSIVLLGLPLALIAGATGYARIQHARALIGVVPPDELEWSVDGEPLLVHSTRRQAGDVERIELRISGPGAPPEPITFDIDHDLFGGGFVGGLDVDADGVPELVLTTRAGPARSRVLEPVDGRIVERTFAELPPEAWAVVDARLERIAPGPYTLVVVLLGVLWFAIGLLRYAWLALRVGWRTLRARRRDDTAGA